MNNVFIGNLANADGNDELDFNGANAWVDFGNVNKITNGDFVFKCVFEYGAGLGYIFAKA